MRASAYEGKKDHDVMKSQSWLLFYLVACAVHWLSGALHIAIPDLSYLPPKHQFFPSTLLGLLIDVGWTLWLKSLNKDNYTLVLRTVFLCF
jgi:hypothetical protein